MTDKKPSRPDVVIEKNIGPDQPGFSFNPTVNAYFYTELLNSKAIKTYQETGVLDRVLTMAEKRLEREHEAEMYRLRNERLKIRSDRQDTKDTFGDRLSARRYATIVIVLIIAVFAGLSWSGKDVSALKGIVGALVALLGAYVGAKTFWPKKFG